MTRTAQIEKQQKLAEIRVQQQETSKSVNMGKAVLSSLNDNFGNPASSAHARAPARRLAPRAYEHALAPPSAHIVVAAQEAPTPVLMASMPEREPEDSSPKRILTTSPILSEKRMPRY